MPTSPLAPGRKPHVFDRTREDRFTPLIRFDD